MTGSGKNSTFASEVLLPCAVLLAMSFCLYANTFGSAWTYDDFPVIVQNPDVRSLSAFFENSRPGRPLREVTYLIDHALFGLSPAGWHFQNIFWHGLNAGLLYVLARRLKATVWASSAAAILFLVHPLQVEVVANISHRKDSLVVAFSLLSFHAYMSAFTAGRKRKAWLGAALVLGIFAFLAKETAVALPVVFLAYEGFFVPPAGRFLLRSRKVWMALLAMGAAGSAVFLSSGGWRAYREGISGLMRLRAAFGEGDLETYGRMVLKSWAFLAGKILWPQALGLEYTYRVPASWTDPWVVGGLALVALGGIVLWATRRSPAICLALVWAVFFFIPVSNLWPLAYFAADRYMYAPLAGLSLAAALLSSSPGLLNRRLAVSALVLTSGLLGWLTWHQNRVWRTSFSLWTQAVAVSPEASFALNNLGWLYLESGEEEKGLTFFLRAAANPWNPNPFDNLGWIYERRGEREKALNCYRRFIEAAGDDPRYRERVVQLREKLQRRFGFTMDD